MGNLTDRIARQSVELARALTASQKANKLTTALLQFVGNGQPILHDDNYREQVQKGYMYNPDVYAIINLITSAAKGVKWCLYEVTDSAKVKRYQRLPSEAKQYRLETVMRLKEQSMEEVYDSDNQLYRIMQNPNPLQGWTEFIEKALGFKLLTGNTYIHGVLLENGANAGTVNEMWIMPSQYMNIKASTGAEALITGYELDYGSQKAQFTPEEVLHMKYWNPDYEAAGSHLYGLSPLRAAARVVRQSNDAYTAQSALLQNSGAMGILAVDPDTMSEEQGSALERSYYNKYGGADKRGKIVITAAKMQWQQIGMNSVDLAIVESQKYSLRDLCNIYQINSALLNDPDNKTYNNMREARKALYMEKVCPELDSIRDELNRWLVGRYNQKTGREYYIDYDLESIPSLQSDMKLVVDQVKDAWWITGNEKRTAMGYDTDVAMEQYFVPSGLMPVRASADVAEARDDAEEAKALDQYGVKQTFSDYPKSASNLAKRAIEFTEQNPNSCATQVGKVRAQQLANREPLSLETVKRTYSFLSRSRAYDTGSFTDKDGRPVCGSISYAYWGGDSMLTWSKNTVEKYG